MPVAAELMDLEACRVWDLLQLTYTICLLRCMRPALHDCWTLSRKALHSGVMAAPVACRASASAAWHTRGRRLGPSAGAVGPPRHRVAHIQMQTPTKIAKDDSSSCKPEGLPGRSGSIQCHHK